MDSELVRALREASARWIKTGEDRFGSHESVAANLATKDCGEWLEMLLVAHDAREGERVAGNVTGWHKGPNGEDVWTVQPSFGEPFEVTRYAAQRQPSVADWAMVPREPTPEMKNRGAYMVSGVTQEGAAVIWRAMLASAPQPQEK